jgi:predicted nuclease of restriction endonuclease-like RecB superfamily
MLQKLLIKKIIELVNKKVGKESEDLRNKIEEIQKTVDGLKKLAHPKADFVCTTCGSKAKRKINKIRRK